MRSGDEVFGPESLIPMLLGILGINSRTSCLCVDMQLRWMMVDARNTLSYPVLASVRHLEGLLEVLAG